MRIKIVHVMSTCSTMVFLRKHIESVSKQGVEYHVVANGFSKSDTDKVDNKCHQISVSRSLFSFKDIYSIFQLRNCLKEIEPDLVVLSTPKAAFVGSLCLRIFFRKIPFIFLVRGLRFTTAVGVKRYLIKKFETFPARLADRTLATSKETKATLMQVVKSASVEVVLNGTANGIDVDVFNAGRSNSIEKSQVRKRLGILDDDLMLLFVGRVAADKGVEELIHAFFKVRKNNPKVKLVVVGENDVTDPVPTDALTLLDSEAIRLGGVENTELPGIYRASDLLVFPSRREGFGVVAVEAAACGTPTLAADIGGLRSSVCEGVSGYFHKVGDAEDLANKLEGILSDRESLKCLGESASQYALENYNSSSYDEYWLSLYMDYVNRKNG